MDIEFVIKEMSRRPRWAFIGRDSQSRMYRIDWREGRKHRVRLAPDMEHAMSFCRMLQVHGKIIGFRVMSHVRHAPNPWVPTLPSEVRTGRIF